MNTPEKKNEVQAVPLYWRFSWVLGLFSLLLLAVSLVKGQTANQLAPGDLWQLWQPALAAGWLLFASSLIKRAVASAARFQEKALKFCGSEDKSCRLGRHVANLVSAKALLFSGGLVLLGVIVTQFAPEPNPYRKAALTVIAASCFYYGGLGFRGAYVVSRAVRDLGLKAVSGGHVNVFHPDGLAGLGFAEMHADKTSRFLLSGIAVFFLGALLASVSWATNTTSGYVSASLSILGIVIWSLFTTLASLSGRHSLATVMSRLRDPMLEDIAEAKKKFFTTDKLGVDLHRTEIQEKAALALRTGMFSRIGGWADLLGIFAAGAAVADFVFRIGPD